MPLPETLSGTRPRKPQSTIKNRMMPIADIASQPAGDVIDIK
jgi:hypothetical protein